MYVPHESAYLETAEWSENRARQRETCLWTTAYHGMNGEAYNAALAGGSVPRLKTGPSSTGHKIGVYCEGEHRKECAHPYCVYFGHSDEPLPDEQGHPESMFTVFLEHWWIETLAEE